MKQEGDTELALAQNLNTFLLNNTSLTWVHVSGCKLAEVLSQVPALRTRELQRIQLSLNGITPESAVILKHINPAKLLHLNLSHNWINHKGLMSLLPLLTSAANLTCLNLSRNGIIEQPNQNQKQELIQFTNSVAASHGLKRLKVLTLSALFLDNWRLQYFLLPLLHHIALLRELDISNNHIYDDISQEVLKKVLELGGESISLNGNELYDEKSNLIVQLALEIKKLKRINLKACMQKKPPECVSLLPEGSYKERLMKKFQTVIPSAGRRVFLNRDNGHLEVLI